MSKQVLTMDLATGKKKLVTVIDSAINAAGKEDVAYSAKAVDEKVLAIDSEISAAITNLKSNTTYQNAVQDIAPTTSQVRTHIDGGRYAIAGQIQIYSAGSAQVSIITDVENYKAEVGPSWKVDCNLPIGTRLVKLLDEKEYQYDGTKWIETNSLLSYQNAINGIALSTAVAPEVDGGRYAIGNTIQVFSAERAQIGLPGKFGYIPRSLKFWTIVGTVTAGARVVNLADQQEYQFNGTTWSDPLADGTRVVNLTSDQVIGGEKEFTANATFDENVEIMKDLTVHGSVGIDKDLVVAGNFTVAGITTTIDTENLIVKDNIITINAGDLGTQAGDGISLGAAGIEINRGTADGSETGAKLPTAKLLFNEPTGTFQAGLDGSLKDIAVLNDSAVPTETKETYSVNKINTMIDSVALTLSNSTLFTYVTSEDVTVGQIIAIGVDGKAFPADSANGAIIDRIAGVAMNTAVTGAITAVAKFGKITKFGGLVPGSYYFLGLAGSVTTVCPSEIGSVICKLGLAVDNSTLLLQIEEGILIES
jgi:hypothetical protein